LFELRGAQNACQRSGHQKKMGPTDTDQQIKTNGGTAAWERGKKKFTGAGVRSPGGHFQGQTKNGKTAGRWVQQGPSGGNMAKGLKIVP